jgi:hypothetical protein
MGKVVIIRHMVYLLRVVWKIPLFLEIDPVRGSQVKVNQETDRSPGQRRKSSVTITKSITL